MLWRQLGFSSNKYVFYMHINFSWNFHQNVFTLTISFIDLNNFIELVLIYRPHPVYQVAGKQTCIFFLLPSAHCLIFSHNQISGWGGGDAHGQGGGCTGGGGGMHVHPVHPPWVRHWLGRPWWLHGSQMVHIFLNVFSIFNFTFQFQQQYIAKTIGAACNYRIPRANLHAGLNFGTCKEFKPLK